MIISSCIIVGMFHGLLSIAITAAFYGFKLLPAMVLFGLSVLVGAVHGFILYSFMHPSEPRDPVGVVGCTSEAAIPTGIGVAEGLSVPSGSHHQLPQLAHPPTIKYLRPAITRPEVTTNTQQRIIEWDTEAQERRRSDAMKVREMIQASYRIPPAPTPPRAYTTPIQLSTFSDSIIPRVVGAASAFAGRPFATKKMSDAELSGLMQASTTHASQSPMLASAISSVLPSTEAIADITAPSKISDPTTASNIQVPSQECMVHMVSSCTDVSATSACGYLSGDSGPAGTLRPLILPTVATTVVESESAGPKPTLTPTTFSISTNGNGPKRPRKPMSPYEVVVGFTNIGNATGAPPTTDGVRSPITPVPQQATTSNEPQPPTQSSLLRTPVANGLGSFDPADSSSV